MKNTYLKLFVLLFILLGRTEQGFSKEDPQKKAISSNKKESNSTIALKQEAQNELNTALNNFNASLSSTQTTVIDKMEDIDLDVSALAEENRSKAQKTMAYLDQNPDKVKAFLSFEDSALRHLPDVEAR
jgi:septal ring factor EnvC (AmiA/AmiB activator)